MTTENPRRAFGSDTRQTLETFRTTVRRKRLRGSATRSGEVAAQGRAGSARLVVERDGDSQCGDADDLSYAQVGEDAGAVALEGEGIFGSPVDRFDSLADRREMRTSAAPVLAARPLARCIERREVGFEVHATEVSGADQDQHLAGRELAAGHQLETDDFLVGPYLDGLPADVSFHATADAPAVALLI